MTDEATPLAARINLMRSRRGDMEIDLEQATIRFMDQVASVEVIPSDHGTVTGRTAPTIEYEGNPCAEIPLPPLNNRTMFAGFDLSSVDIGLVERRVMTQLDFYREMYRDFSRLFMPKTTSDFEGVPHVKQKPVKKVKAKDELAMRAAQRKAAKRALLEQITAEAVPKKRAREGRWTPHVKRALDV